MSGSTQLTAGKVRVASTLLEASLLVVFVALFATGMVQRGDGPLDEGRWWPIRLGPAAVPALLVVGAHVVKRLLRPRPRDFVIAGALGCGLAAAAAPGLSPLLRLRDLCIGSLTGAVALGVFVDVDKVGADALEQRTTTAVLRLGAMLVTLGAMPAAIAGGAVLALPTVAMGLFVLAGVARAEAAAARSGRPGALVRASLAVGLFALGVGMLLAAPLLSLGVDIR